MSWQDSAHCKDMHWEIFFTVPSKGQSAEPAKEVCRGCPVRQECLDYAIGTALASHQVEGIWGGTNKTERSQMVIKIRAERRRAAMGSRT